MLVERCFLPDTIVTAARRQISADLGGEILILSLDSGSYFLLSGAGVRVWESLGEPKSVAEIERTLLDTFDVDPERCRQDLDHLLRGLAERGLVELDERPDC